MRSENEWPMEEEEVENAVRQVEAEARMRRVARRVGALLFVVVFLVDVFASPELLAAVSRLCGS